MISLIRRPCQTEEKDHHLESLWGNCNAFVLPSAIFPVPIDDPDLIVCIYVILFVLWNKQQRTSIFYIFIWRFSSYSILLSKLVDGGRGLSRRKGILTDISIVWTLYRSLWEVHSREGQSWEKTLWNQGIWKIQESEEGDASISWEGRSIYLVNNPSDPLGLYDGRNEMVSNRFHRGEKATWEMEEDDK